MKKTILMTCIATFTLLFSVNSLANIYKWTDKNGSVHYSARPPTHTKQINTKIKDIEDKIRFAAGKHRPSSQTSTTQQNNQKTNSSASSANSDVKLSPPGKKLIAYCQKQRANLQSLKKNFRSIWIEPNGKKSSLSQAQRKEKVKYLIKKIAEDCEGV